jgi:hypothetical protein
MSLGSGLRGEWLQRHQRHRQPLDPEDASSRITAYVYGNILVMTALIALDPPDLLGSTAVAYVVGTGLSTFVAHLVAELAGFGFRTERRMTLADVRHEARGSVPIISAILIPVLLVLAALWGWLGEELALRLAIAVTVVRLALFGWVVGHLKGRKASTYSVAVGILLAVGGTAAAIIKFWLTH